MDLDTSTRPTNLKGRGWLREQPGATLRRLYSVGLLVPCKDESTATTTLWRYSKQDVDRFRETYIGSEEAADMLGIPLLALQKWAKAGELPAVSGPIVDGSRHYRFRRDDILTWRGERVTEVEACALLDVSSPSFYRYVQEGRIGVLSDPERRHRRWYSRADVLRLKAELDAKPGSVARRKARDRERSKRNDPERSGL